MTLIFRLFSKRRFGLFVCVNDALPLILLESHPFLLSKVNDLAIDKVIDLIDGHAFELCRRDSIKNPLLIFLELFIVTKHVLDL